MADNSHPSEELVGRRIRAHRKSRRGCGNCKLRKVKCDESKPICKKCAAYGVFCNYDFKHSDLQLAVDGAFNIEPQQRNPASMTQLIPRGIDQSLRQQWTVSMENDSPYRFGERDLELLTKFQIRTVVTVTADKSLLTLQEEFVKLAFFHPFLMHSILATTQMHDRYLSASANTKLSPAEAFHWYQSIALFNDKLSGPMEDSERDALWPAAFLLGVVAFYFIEANTPEEAWPLKQASSLDLNWLRMSIGKKALITVAQPWRANSVFYEWALEYSKKSATSRAVPRTASIEAGLKGLPFEFIKLYGLDAPPTADIDPYQTAASILTKSPYIDRFDTTHLNFFSFITEMQPEFKLLLEQKDPRALLLLAYWYAKVCQTQLWWIYHRAALECRAICIYLERYHRCEPEIQKLLEYPRMMFGFMGDSIER